VAVRIRLQRKGAKHMAFFRIVAADSRSPRDGRFIEQLGYYDPLREPPDISVDTEKVIGWLSKGAQPSETVRALFSRVGILETWHEVKKGKPLDELRHIEDEARKRIEAQAAMDRRKEAAEAKEKAEAPAKPEEKPEEKAKAEEQSGPDEGPPPDDGAEAAGGEKTPVEPPAEEPAADTHEEVEAEAGSERVEPEGAEGEGEVAGGEEAPSEEKQSE
jgi:small subunit ribosomal protein S16